MCAFSNVIAVLRVNNAQKISNTLWWWQIHIHKLRVRGNDDDDNYDLNIIHSILYTTCTN